MIPVIYLCHRCSQNFTVMQAQNGHDDDITLCFTCIDEILGKPWPHRKLKKPEPQ